MSADSGVRTTRDYIEHHLVNWTYGQGFWSVNLDSLGVAMCTGCGLFFLYLWMSRRLSVDRPSRLQMILEWPVEWISQLLVNTIPKGLQPLPWLGPFALVSLLWIGAMNLLDLLPLDLANSITDHFFHLENFRLVPTVDLNVTLGLALGALIFSFMGILQLHGVKGLCQEMLLRPFSHWTLAPFNFALAFVERFTKVLSLSMRLFGNLIAGEMIFAILSAICPIWQIHWIIALPLSMLHLFVAGLQAFIFMLITTLWIASAYEQH